jgi:hypothetical protein
MSTKNETITQELPKSIVPKSIEESPKSTIEESPKSTKENWNKDKDVQTWLKNRQERPQSSDEDRIQQIGFWIITVKRDMWDIAGDVFQRPLPETPEKAIKYIKQNAPKETWDWRLHPKGELYPEGELYVNWWCYMRKFIDDHPYLKKTDPFMNNPPLLTKEQKEKLKETQFIYPTLNKWSIFFKTEGLSIKAVQDMVLVKFAEWLLILAADRQMFRDENMRTGIPRIVIARGGKKQLKIFLDETKLKIFLDGESDTNIQVRDASVVYIMQEGSKILSERGFGMGAWKDINKKYTWLLSEK